jgi:hypothetical protein
MQEGEEVEGQRGSWRNVDGLNQTREGKKKDSVGETL